MSRLPGESFAYSFHIGKSESQRRLGSRQASIEIKKKSRIGYGFSLGMGRMTFRSDMLVNAIYGPPPGTGPRNATGDGYHSAGRLLVIILQRCFDD